jgi:YidC/Oxa1 family membrane protein insertase
MNKKTFFDQLILAGALSLAAYFFMQWYFGSKNKTPDIPKRTAPALVKAFEGITSVAPLPQPKAKEELASLQKSIDESDKDDYALWAHLRSGVLQQFVLNDDKGAIKQYDAVISGKKRDALEAQAMYLKGDLLWRQEEIAKTSHKPGSQALEEILTTGRSSQSFLDLKIYVPSQELPLGQMPQQWNEKALRDINGTLAKPDPQGILDRVNEYYSGTTFYKVVDGLVKLLGAQPSYSYGLALILLAIFTRTIMQPLIKKQYRSMAAMQKIGPDMKKIQDRYKDKKDPESQRKMMSEIKMLQKEHGVNPLGCGVSLVIQLPLFFFVILPLIYHYQAKMELANASFLWIHSLARPDIPLLVLYAISMFFSTRLSSAPPTDDQQKMMQRMMSFMSPVFAFVLWSYPSAFTLYWMVYNAMSTVLQWRLMKGDDPTKKVIPTLLGTGSVATATATISKVDPSEIVPARPEKNGSQSNNGQSKKRSKSRR